MPILTSQDNIKEEGLSSAVQDYYTIDSKDDDLVRMIDSRISGATKENEALKKEGKRNECYWGTDQLKGISLRYFNSRIVQNRIYMGTETMVPIITTKPAEPVISIHDDDEEDSEDSKGFIEALDKVLMDKYSDEDYPQQKLFEMIARHLLLYKIGIPKIIWDKSIDDYLVEYVHPHKIILGTEGHYNQDVWIAQWMEKSLKELVTMFSEKEDNIMANLFPGSKVSMEQYGNTPVGFWEYWPEDGSYVVWKMNNVILQKKRNPYLIWKDDKTFDREKNHFNYPHKPFMFLNSQNLGRYVWDDTSPISQGISMQDGVNYMQRIITDTARDQGILVGAEEAIDRDELGKYTGAPDHKLSIKGGDPSRALFRVQPKQLAPFIQDNLMHLEGALDNIMGTHSTTRGERSKAPTLGQDLLSKEADYGRIDAIVRGVERVASEIYNWEIQMMMVKYKKEHYQRILGKKNGEKLFKDIKDYNKRGIKIVVKPGSTLPTDKTSQRQEALDLAKMNKISDLDLFERMDFPNAREMAKNLYLQNNAPEKLYPDLVEEINRDRGMEGSMPPGQAPPPGSMPQMGLPAPGMPPEGGIPPQPMQPMPQPMQPAAITPDMNQGMPQPMQQPEQPEMGTEHTQALLAGQDVPPFANIPPEQYMDHVQREFAFMGSGSFDQVDQQIQAHYAQHALQERDIINSQQPNA
jgi:hypothetical protein